MKLNRFLSVFLLGLGCILVFVGIIATVVPSIQNAQFQLVLSSFEMPSRNFFVNWINHAMTFALQNSYLVIGIGCALVLVGIILMLVIRPEQQPQKAAPRVPHAPAYQKPKDAQKNAPSQAWRPTKAQTLQDENPFADTSVSSLLMPRGRTEKTKASTIPAYKPILESAQAEPAFDPASVTPYVKPVILSQEPVAPPAVKAEPAAPRQAPAKLDHSTIPVLLRSQAPTTPVSTMPESVAAPAMPFAPSSKEHAGPVHIRSTFVAKSADAAPAKEEPKHDIIKPPKPSSRIKSTMGKHS